MDKLAPWPQGIVRTLIAGLLAWTVVVQGFAMAASARGGAIDFGVSSTDFERCAANVGSNDHRHSPEHQVPCSCCIPCRSGQIGGLAALPTVPPTTTTFSFPTPDVVRNDLFLSAEAALPLGWISSWSQRAPPIA